MRRECGGTQVTPPKAQVGSSQGGVDTSCLTYLCQEVQELLLFATYLRAEIKHGWGAQTLTQDLSRSRHGGCRLMNEPGSVVFGGLAVIEIPQDSRQGR